MLSLGYCKRKANRRPHIVLVVSDDQGWNDVSWHNPDVLTPNMDKLAKRGVRLENKYTVYTPTKFYKMAFDAGKFLKTPDLEGFDNLKKEELVLLAKHLKLDFKVSMRKQIIKNLVIDKLVDAEILGEEALELKVETVDAFKLKQLELEHKLKLKELEMKERLEMDKKEKEDEFKLKELKMKEKEKLKEFEMRERLEMEKMKIEMVKEENNTKVQQKSEYFDEQKIYVWFPDFVKKQSINIFHSLRKLLII
ncbi:Hypothetical predicted protein [Mytilus galloprovincialis]|uniref:Sulfatase N-terminal domain-containing protein n=1 Tax=Mytilus galloprovincialis TaxID=29158 RepID=A0A8B6CZ42_MYTGA|nr:Hypothetical predicted protein [Mytilus galloprovincialis]